MVFKQPEYQEGELYHHGIKGQKWGIRRYQRLDGTLTPAGVERYGHAPEQVKELRLRRQIARNEMFGVGLSSSQRNLPYQATKEFKKSGKYDEYMKADYLSKESIQKAHSFVKEVAGAQLKQLGYDDTEKGREYLASFKWFQDRVPYVSGELKAYRWKTEPSYSKKTKYKHVNDPKLDYRK